METYILPAAILLGSVIIGLFIFLRKGGITKGKAEEFNQKIILLSDEKSKAEANVNLLRENIEKNEKELFEEREKNISLNSNISKIIAENKNLIEKLEDQKTEIEELQKKFTDAFENLANRIFEEKSLKFTEKNRANLDEILNPLKERIKEFETKVEETHKKNLVSNTSLIEQIKSLEKLNKQISDDASNLTKALKGDVKVQGNWGEVILERILEESGLQKGIEYESQTSFTDDEGNRRFLDVIVKLPDKKHIIIDSKLSLVNYEQLVAAEMEKQIEKSLKALITSVRAHIDDLHKKHYQDLKGLNSPDFVLLFMPIEGSFSVVVQNDNSIYKYALDKHIVIVSPSTLLATLRTITFIWRQENQTKNALEIARQSGNLYDAFVRMLEDLDKVGVNIERAEKSFQDAIKKLSTGRGNLLSRVENIKKLGAKASKSIPEKFIGDDVPELIE